MLVPRATDIPFNFDRPIAWKLLNQRSTASLSSSLQRSRISRCKTSWTSESITKLYANRFWRVLLVWFVLLITDRCLKCCCRLGFEHYYSVANHGSIFISITVYVTVSLWVVPLWGPSGDSGKPAASSRPAWCQPPCSKNDILRRLAPPGFPCLSLSHPSSTENLNWKGFWSMNKKKPPPKAGVLKGQRECVLVSTTWAFLLTKSY